MIWVFIVLAFVAGEVEGHKVGGGKTKAQCEELRAKLQEQIQSTPEVQISFSECISVKVPKAPPPKPQPEAESK